MNLRKFIFYAMGIFVLALGIVLTIHSNLGTSPFDALLVGLYRSFGLTVGSWEIVVGILMVLFNAIAQRQRPEYFALVTSLITGSCIDIWIFLLTDWFYPTTLITQSLCLFLGMVISGLGIAIYLQVDFAPNPMDRTMLVIQDLTRFNIAISRAIINIVLVIFALIFGGSIGVGTILIALFSGAVIKFFLPYMAELEKRTRSPRTA
jgi:hypothetical protein